MRLAVTVAIGLMVFGCAPDAGPPPLLAPAPVPFPAPPAPVPSPPEPPPVLVAPGLTSLWAMVIDEGGGCIMGATVEVVAGQAAGRTITQTNPCSYWDAGGGFILADLTPGLELTLRASASGYQSAEATATPLATGPFRVFAVVLSRAR